MNGTFSSPRYPHSDFRLKIAQLTTGGDGDVTFCYCSVCREMTVTHVNGVLEGLEVLVQKAAGGSYIEIRLKPVYMGEHRVAVLRHSKETESWAVLGL